MPRLASVFRCAFTLVVLAFVGSGPALAATASASASEPLVEGDLAAGVVARRLRWASRFAEIEPEYTLSDAPGLALELRVRPLHDGGDWTSGLALVGSVSGARGVTRGESGRPLETRIWQWDAGLRLAVSRDPEIALDLRHGVHSFTMEPDARYGRWVASVDYRFVRAGLELVIARGEPFLRASVGHRVVSSAGELDSSEHVSGLSVVGRDAEIALGMRVHRRVRLYLAASYTHYSLSVGSLDAGTDAYAAVSIGALVASATGEAP